MLNLQRIYAMTYVYVLIHNWVKYVLNYFICFYAPVFSWDLHEIFMKFEKGTCENAGTLWLMLLEEIFSPIVAISVVKS